MTKAQVDYRLNMKRRGLKELTLRIPDEPALIERLRLIARVAREDLLQASLRAQDQKEPKP